MFPAVCAVVVVTPGCELQNNRGGWGVWLSKLTRDTNTRMFVTQV